MPRIKRKKSVISEINQGLELGVELIRTVESIIASVRAPRESLTAEPPHLDLSPYEILGVPPSASEKEFKHRYRELMKLYHSDRGSGSDAMAKRVNEAYEQIFEDKGWRK